MPTNIVPVSTFTSPVVAPVDGDARNAASVLTALQALTNRGEYVKDIVESSGITLVRPVSGLTALKALTVGSAYVTAFVYDDDGFGMWFWVPGSAAPVVTNFIEASTYGSAPVGKWWSQMAAVVTLGGASGTATRQSVDRLPVPNRIVSLADKYETGATLDVVATGSTNYADTGFFSDDVVLQVGDMVKVHCNFSLSNDHPENAYYARLASYDGATTAALAGSERNLYAPAAAVSQSVPVHLMGYHLVTVADTYSYKLQVSGGNTNTLRVWASRHIMVEVIRPLWRGRAAESEHRTGGSGASEFARVLIARQIVGADDQLREAGGSLAGAR